VAAADKGDTTVHFGSPAEIFGVDGIIILIVVVLVLFGSTQIPKLARSLGSAQKEFKKGLDEGSADDGKGTKAVAQAIPPAAVAPPTPPAPTTVTVETNGDGSAAASS
jgi:sec-independent protein translocase protein TatA